MKHTIEDFNWLLNLDFRTFVKKAFETLSGDEFLNSPYIDVLCYKLMQVYKGESNKIIINIPPRYLKSTICSVAFPAWVFGKNPRAKFLCVSYADDLAVKMAMDCKKVMSSAWYKAAFPNTKISQSKHSTRDFETTLGGERFATSIEGVVTGRGGDYIIVDDPIKPADANSDLLRNKVNNFYSTTLISRSNNKKNGKIIVIMQRTHQNDFAGHLQEVDPDFELIKMPVSAEEKELWHYETFLGEKKVFRRKIGELLHPEREDFKTLAKIKNGMTPYDFSCQYQQNPMSRGGNIIKKEWLVKYNRAEIIDKLIRGVIKGFPISMSWDTASKIGQDNDYSVCITYARVWDHEKDCDLVYILDVYREKLTFPDLVEKAEEMYHHAPDKYKDFWCRDIDRIIVEDINTGTGLVQYLQTSIGSSIIEPWKPIADKATRFKSISAFLAKGNILFPDDNPPWWADFEREVLVFPNGKHDDQCDALSQLIAFENSR